MIAAIRFEPLGVFDGDTYGAYFIDIFDNSGNPVNGDGIIVYYHYTRGSTIGPLVAISVPGLSRKIDEGLVQTGDGDLLSYVIDSYDSSSDLPPVTNGSPDLRLISVGIDKKADSAGNNGKVTIYATSSFGPILYYIDNVLQSGNALLTVTAGAHTAKVNDTNGVPIELDFTVPQLTSILDTTPEVTVGELVSRWNAAFNPVNFTYQRRDFEVIGISQDDTTLKPKIVLNTDLTGLEVGDYVYLDAGLTNGLSTYKGALKVLRIDGINTIVVDTDYIAADTVTGYANSDTLRPYYKVITKIKYVDPATGRFKTIVSTNRPGNDGVTKADIASFLQSILKPQPDLSNYTAVNYRDMGLSASYQVSYAEVWEGNTPEYSDIDTPFYVIYAAKQLGDQYGGNLFNYVTQQGGQQLAKWLTDFVEPSYTVGFPCDLGFIYSEQIAGKQIYSKVTGLDINRTPLGTSTVTTFLLNENSSFLLQQDGYKFIIARQQLVNTPIVEHVGLNRLLINQDLGPTCCYLQIQLFYDEGSNHIPVTEPIIVRQDRTCTGGHPVYLRWIGLNGSWQYFRFNYNQSLSLEVQNPVIVKDYVFDWQNTEGIERKISNNANEKVQVYADALDNNDMQGLKSIKYSPIVQVLTSNNPIKWQTIIVNSGTFSEGETQNGQSEFTITFNKPSINIQQQ